MKRNLVLYLITLAVFAATDLLFLGLVASGLFQAQVGDMLGPIRPLAALLFYLLYPVGIVIFVSRAQPTSRGRLLYGALFGLFSFATFELTAMALLRHWTWVVVVVDTGWGMVVTAIAAAAGAWIADRVRAPG